MCENCPRVPPMYQIPQVPPNARYEMRPDARYQMGLDESYNFLRDMESSITASLRTKDRMLGGAPFGSPKPRTTYEKENAKMNTETASKLRNLVGQNAPVKTTDGSTVEGRIIRVYDEPMAVVRTPGGDERFVPARLVRELSEDETKDFLLREREERAAQRERDAKVALSELREVLSEATEEGAFGRLSLPAYVHEAIARLASTDDDELPGAEGVTDGAR